MPEVPKQNMSSISFSQSLLQKIPTENNKFCPWNLKSRAIHQSDFVALCKTSKYSVNTFRRYTRKSGLASFKSLWYSISLV